MARRPFGSGYIYVLVALIGFIVADLAILSFRESLMPKSAPPAPQQTYRPPQAIPRDKYASIEKRNIFNIDGKIPEAIGGSSQNQPQVDPEPVRTNIPGLTLIGTLVHSNPGKSVASVKTATSGETVGAFRIGDIIDGVGEVLEISRGKIIFRNLVSRFREFLELPQDARINLGLAAGPKGGVRQEGEVTVVNEFERSIQRTDVERLTKNLPEVLQQARAVPEGDGFRIVDIQPGSIYERLGIKKGDLIKTVNGEVVDSVQKAMEAYNALKGANNISLGIERNGRPETMNFTVN